MDLEVRHLRLVTAVAEHQSLTKAGDHLNLSQSALSHQLRDIEDRLGSRLFHRLNKQMIPTPAGERLLESARSVLAELAAAEDAIRGGLAPRPTPVRFATECNTAYHWLPPVLKVLRQSFPHIDVRIEPAATSDPLGRLLDGKIDLALVTSKIRNPRVVSTSLFDDEQLLVVPGGHPLTKRPFVRPGDLRGERLLTYAGLHQSDFVRDVLRPAGVLPDRVEVVQLTEATIELVRAGLGVAALSRWVVEPFMQDASLGALRITSEGFFKHWRAVMLPHLCKADHIREFLNLVIANSPGGRHHILPFSSATRRAKTAKAAKAAKIARSR